MKINIASTSVRAKYLRSLPINTVYKDPRNGQYYEVVEKCSGSTLSKIAIPYFGQTDDAIEINVPDELLKVEHPLRKNIVAIMKEKVAQMEYEKDQLLVCLGPKADSDDFKTMFVNKLFETNKELFYLSNSGIVFSISKDANVDQDENYKRLMTYVRETKHDKAKMKALLNNQYGLKLGLNVIKNIIQHTQNLPTSSCEHGH